MDDPHARRLREQFDWLQHQLEQLPSRNDSAWILNTGSQFCPGLHTLRQRLLPELVSVLRPNLDAAVVQEMAEVMVNMATSTSSRRFSPCCRRTHNCASRNGSRTTRGRNIWPCHLLRSSYLRLRHRMRGQLIPAPRPRLHLGEGRRTSMRPDRPGPNSGNSTLQLYEHDAPASNVGRSLPIAYTTLPLLYTLQAKLHDPSVFRIPCQACGPIIARARHICTHYMTYHTGIHSLCHRRACLCSQRDTDTDDQQAQCQPARRRTERPPRHSRTTAQALGVLLSLSAMLYVTDRQRRTCVCSCWFTRRCATGLYRRRHSAAGPVQRARAVSAAPRTETGPRATMIGGDASPTMPKQH